MEFWLIVAAVVLAVIVLVVWRRRSGAGTKQSIHGERNNITDNHAGGVGGGGPGFGL